MSKYTVISTQPTVYNDPVKGVINGVLVQFKIDDYDELHEIRAPKLNAQDVKAAIEEVVKQRDDLAALGQ